MAKTVMRKVKTDGPHQDGDHRVYHPDCHTCVAAQGRNRRHQRKPAPPEEGALGVDLIVDEPLILVTTTMVRSDNGTSTQRVVTATPLNGKDAEACASVAAPSTARPSGPGASRGAIKRRVPDDRLLPSPLCPRPLRPTSLFPLS